MISRLLPQLESIEADGPTEYTAANFVSGVKHLPVRYSFSS
jgi:hypothetical protein